MTSDDFVPAGFDPPTSLITDEFHLEPLGPQHNESDHAAWTSSIEHIRSTPGYPDGSWPPRGGMTLERNLADLRRHADDFQRRAGFTFTVLDPGDRDVIGCVYVYPSPPRSGTSPCSRGSAPTGRPSTYLWPTPSQAGWPPTGRGSAWTAAVVDGHRRGASRYAAPAGGGIGGSAVSGGVIGMTSQGPGRVTHVQASGLAGFPGVQATLGPELPVAVAGQECGARPVEASA